MCAGLWKSSSLVVITGDRKRRRPLLRGGGRATVSLSWDVSPIHWLVPKKRAATSFGREEMEIQCPGQSLSLSYARNRVAAGLERRKSTKRERERGGRGPTATTTLRHTRLGHPFSPRGFLPLPRASSNFPHIALFVVFVMCSYCSDIIPLYFTTYTAWRRGSISNVARRRLLLCFACSKVPG